MIPRFFAEMCDAPLNIDYALVFADWLDDHGSEDDKLIAGLIRLHHRWATVRWTGEQIPTPQHPLELLGHYTKQNLYGFLNQDGYRPRAHFGILNIGLSPKDFFAVMPVVSDEQWQWVGGLQVHLGSTNTDKMVLHPRFKTIRRLELNDYRTLRDDEKVITADNHMVVLAKQALPWLRSLDLSEIRPETATELSAAPWWRNINHLEICRNLPTALLHSLRDCPLQIIEIKRLDDNEVFDLPTLVDALPTTVRRIYLDNNYVGPLEANWSRLTSLEGVHYNPRQRRIGLPQNVFSRSYPHLWHSASLWGG